MRGIGSGSIVTSLLALSLLQCGGDGGSGGPANFDAFVGTWSCESTSTVTLTKPSGVPAMTSTTPVTLEVKKSGASTVTIGQVGDTTCAAELRVSGNSGTLATGFTCDQGDQTLKVQSAQIKASGNKLTGTRTASISGTTNTGEQESGTATTKIDCTRLSGPADAGGNPGTGGNPGSGGNSGDGGNAPPGGGDCTTQQDCATCCDDRMPDGVDRLQGLLIDCACQVCATECAASLCDSANPNQPAQGDACDTCARASFDTDGSCVQSTADACKADSTCAPYATCIASCP